MAQDNSPRQARTKQPAFVVDRLDQSSAVQFFKAYRLHCAVPLVLASRLQP